MAARNPLNIGAAARAMSNFGFTRLRVVNPYDVAFREARSAVGAPALLANAEEYKSVAESVADCSLVVGTTAARDRELQHPLRLLPEASILIRQQLAAGPVALLFGSEKRGLANEDLSHCHWLLRIPTREEHVSMNLGQAVAICLYELTCELTSPPFSCNTARQAVTTDYRGAQPSSAATEESSQAGNISNDSGCASATAGNLERISAVLLETLRASGYLQPQAEAATEEKIRRMIHRLNLSPEDAELWLGMLRQMAWKMKAGEKPER